MIKAPSDRIDTGFRRIAKRPFLDYLARRGSVAAKDEIRLLDQEAG